MDSLKRTFLQKLEMTPTSYVRYLHDRVAWEAQLVGILGARGVGKSTLVLQHIKLHENIGTTLYVSADDLWFTTHRIVDLAHEFYLNGGKALYIDEIHKYENWSQEIKNIYDTYPGLRVVYTGSSILELEKGGGDLSRRTLEYTLYGLSFREYLIIDKGIDVPVHSLEDILSHRIQFDFISHRPVALFKEYIQRGYYPYCNEPDYYLRLKAIVNRILEYDIRDFAEMSASTVHALKKMMYIIAQSSPFKPNYTKIAQDININRQLTADLMIYLEKAQLINILRNNAYGISSLGKVDKIYLNNTNLAYALVGGMADVGNIRETVFLSSVKPVADVTSSPASDFLVEQKYTFEVGGKNKKRKQIQGLENAYVVKDDTEHGYDNVIPIWTLGLLY